MTTPALSRPRRYIGAGSTPDRGSVTPLVVGMVACLLLLGAGVTAATSAFLARQDLQNACDGAAAAAADADRAGYYLGAPDPSATPGPAAQAARDYLAERNPQVRIDAIVLAGSVQLTCSGSADITFGALFGAGHLTQSVQAVGHPVL